MNPNSPILKETPMQTNKYIINIDDLPETILQEILVKFHIKSIVIFKLVCKRWKSIVESVTFRNLFVCMHQKSSCSWSLLRKHHHDLNTTVEIIASYGCVRWGLPQSLGSYISSSGSEIKSFVIKATSSGLLLIVTQDDMYYVGNPVSREWVKIRSCTSNLHCKKLGLATRVDENGVVLGYKVVLVNNTRFKEATNLTLQIYSSETGEWTCENVRCPCPIPWSSPLSPEPIGLNGTLHWVTQGEYGNDAGGIVAIDLYNGSSLAENQCWVIPFPDGNLRFTTINENFMIWTIWSRRACTTSGGFIMYINTVSESKMKVWRLKKDYYRIESGEYYWQLSWEIDLARVDYGVGSIPMVMHPFDTDVVYLWSEEKSCLVSINLQKQNTTLHKESENNSTDGCIIRSLETCKSTLKNPYALPL